MMVVNELRQKQPSDLLCGAETWRLHNKSAVYDFKYFQGLPLGLLEFEDVYPN